jgi:hypothetical protein
MLRSWLLLACFVAGQLMVLAHQHPDATGLPGIYESSKNIPHQTVKEKCYMCDVMHHNTMLIAYQVYLNPVPVIAYSFNVYTYQSSAAKLIPAGGRAPPVA